jgi:1-acyl-sn-glycerol-3-phosphate acyltransferase
VSALSSARAAARSAAFVGTTLSLWGCLDVDILLRPSADREALLHKWVLRWAGALLDIFAVSVHARGRFVGDGAPYPGGEGGVGRVFVMNHRSGMDIPIVFAKTEAHLVSRHDLAAWPLIGRGARRLGTLFVDRSSMRSGATVLKAMTRTLERGCGVAIFPEGTAFSGDEVRAFRPGAFNAALRTGAEIVPMGIAYADEAAMFGDETFGAHMQRVAGLPELQVALEVGEPIAATGNVAALRDATRERVQALVHGARARLDGARS